MELLRRKWLERFLSLPKRPVRSPTATTGTVWPAPFTTSSDPDPRKFSTTPRNSVLCEPVVCLDEKPVPLQADVRPPSPAKPGKPAKQDNEYERCDTANLFGAVEPLTGRHFTTATPDRSGAEFARLVENIVAQ
jgi:hypothetical protein